MHQKNKLSTYKARITRAANKVAPKQTLSNYLEFYNTVFTVMDEAYHIGIYDDVYKHICNKLIILKLSNTIFRHFRVFLQSRPKEIGLKYLPSVEWDGFVEYVLGLNLLFGNSYDYSSSSK